MIASVAPIGPSDASPPARSQPSAAQAPGEPTDDSDSAGALLKRGFDFFSADKNQEAADMFRAAVATGNLNDAGRALAYWHIYVAEQSMAHVDIAADALEAFVVVSQDVLEIRGQLKYAEDDSGDFVDRFDLKRRLARARATLSADWAGHVGIFGRSSRNPVPIHSVTEMNYFLELAPPCAQANDRSVAAGPQQSGAAGVSEVDMSCNAGAGKVSYYFQVVPE